MTLRERLARLVGGIFARPSRPLLEATDVVDEFGLELRRETTAAVLERREAVLTLPTVGIDNDDPLYRQAGGATRYARRDLSPISQDRMIEICWNLLETNPFAKRLIELMTDLIVGEGVKATAKDPKTKSILDRTWDHPVNRLGTRTRELYKAFSVTGELCLPVARNPITGIPQLGYIDPGQIARVHTRIDNVMVPEFVELKASAGQSDGPKLKIVQEDPISGRLEGDCFYFRTNALPNSARGRSDLLTLADWLDLYDQLMFAEVERVKLFSSFVYDLQVQGGTTESIEEAKRGLMVGGQAPASGSVFGHNEKVTLEAITPDLKATDRSEVGKMLAIHMAGAIGFPVSWLGFTDSNRATIEGQNDISLKTPAARQKEFAGHLGMICRFAIEGATTFNRALYRDVEGIDFSIEMPEIAAKDIARVGTVLAGVVSAMDTAMANATMSRRAAALVVTSLIRHLGVDLDVEEVLREADQEKADRQEQDDARQAMIAAATAANQAIDAGKPPKPGKPKPAAPPADNQEDA